MPSGWRAEALVRLKRRSRERRVSGLTRVARKRSSAPYRDDPVSQRNQPSPARALIAAVTNGYISGSIAELASVPAFADHPNCPAEGVFRICLTLLAACTGRHVVGTFQSLNRQIEAGGHTKLTRTVFCQ
jgi:hypothetical protein